jgi:2'-5' RNA ligase
VSLPHGGSRTLGVTIELPTEVRNDIDAARARYGSHADDWAAHVTILAPIEADDGVMDAVIEHLQCVADGTASFRMVLRGTGTFRPVSPVVFVAVAEGISACEQLEAAVRSGDLGVEARFPYHPHVTLAHDVPGEALDRAFEDLAHYVAAFTVSSICLHENVGGEWTLVREFPFGVLGPEELSVDVAT